MRTAPPLDLLLACASAVIAASWFILEIGAPNQLRGWSGTLSCTLYLLLGWGTTKLYCARWADVARNSAMLWLLEHLVLPVLVLLIATRFHADRFFDSLTGTAILVACFVAFADLRGRVRDYLAKVMPHSAAESSVYLTYPPRERMDLLPMDALYWGVITLAVVRALRWH